MVHFDTTIARELWFALKVLKLFTVHGCAGQKAGVCKVAVTRTEAKYQILIILVLVTACCLQHFWLDWSVFVIGLLLGLGLKNRTVMNRSIFQPKKDIPKPCNGQSWHATSRSACSVAAIRHHHGIGTQPVNHSKPTYFWLACLIRIMSKDFGGMLLCYGLLLRGQLRQWSMVERPVEKLQSQRSVENLYFSPGFSTWVCRDLYSVQLRTFVPDFFRHQVLEKKNLRYLPSSLWKCWGVFAQQEAQILVLHFFCAIWCSFDFCPRLGEEVHALFVCWCPWPVEAIMTWLHDIIRPSMPFHASVPGLGGFLAMLACGLFAASNVKAWRFVKIE